MQPLVKEALNPDEMDTLEYLLECATKSIGRAAPQWPTIQMRLVIRDMWASFNDIVIDNAFAVRAEHALYPDIDFEENLEPPF